MQNKACGWFFILLCLTVAVPNPLRARVHGVKRGSVRKPPQANKGVEVIGQSVTLLPGGQWLLMGGRSSVGPVTGVYLRDSRSGIVKQLSGNLAVARAWHTATLLPDGTIFVFGGYGQDGRLIQDAEIYDPETQNSHLLLAGELIPRAHHTATLITQGEVLLAGGVGPRGDVDATMQLWDPVTRTVQTLATLMLMPRQDHSANLDADGTVLFSKGTNRTNLPITFGEVLDPNTFGERIETNPVTLQHKGIPFIAASIPLNNTNDVAVNSRIALRFSQALNVTTVNADTVSLSGPNGLVSANVVPAEGGMLAFITPTALLSEGTTYTLVVRGVQDSAGQILEDAQVVFTTAGDGAGVLGSGSATNGDDETGPLDDHFHRLPPLKAASGVTALAGQVLKLNATPLVHVLLQIDDKKTFTDGSGRFLLKDITAGHHVMIIDGTTANHHGIEYGIYEDGVDVAAAQTNVLNYTIWMTHLDTEHEVTIPSPTTDEVVITTPKLPGLELHLPASTVIRDRNGNVVTSLTITPVPINQPPFPLPPGVQVPIYFTIQPGAAYLEVGSNPQWQKGARLIYPNTFHYPAGTVFDFWNYDADKKGWFIYGHGKVSQDKKSVIPDPGVEIYEFTGAMVGNPSAAPPSGPPGGCGCGAGEPVDLSTGLFTYEKTDLVLPDVIPLNLRRTYRPNDNQSRALGIGTTHWYEMFIVGDHSPYTYQELILPDGSRIHFYRTSPGTGTAGAVYAHTSTKTSWYGATISYGPPGFLGAAWGLTTKDGTTYYFPDALAQTNPALMALIGIRDRYGNTVMINRDSNGNVTRITSPNGRYISFQHDTSNRITQTQDNIGRTVQYQYDAVGRIQQVTDAAGGLWKYTYDSNNNMLTVQDARGITYLTNQYDSGNHVTKQTQADGTTYQFTWTFSSNTAQPPYFVQGGLPSGGSAGAVIGFRNCATCNEGYQPLVTQVDVTDPDGNVRRVQFNSTGYIASDTYALGKPEQQTFTYAYYADNLVQSVTDQLGRVTAYSYDANGNVSSVTRLSGTSNAVSTTAVFDGVFNQLLSFTDPLSHTTNFAYDTLGSLTTITDALQHQSSFTHDTEGRVASGTDSLSNATNFSYYLGDLAAITDPLSRTTTRFTDAAGRLIAVTDPLGKTTHFAYNTLNQITSQTEALGNQTSFSYDLNGNLLSVTDANNHATQYTYDNMDRLATRKDALLNQESYQYDSNGNLTQFTDRRGKVTTYSYDGLNRRTFAGFATQAGPTYESTVTNTYDAGNRLTQIVDSISGTITRGYDGLDRLTSEATPGSNTLSYTYDLAGRRASLTVPGQSVANYTFDNANRLTQIAQGTATVSFNYDNANRRTTLTLPNGITTSYSYDNASQLTGLTYVNGSTSLGALTYSYDLVGRRAGVGGSYAQTILPLAVSTAAYNANNQLTTWGTASLFYDLNGNMTSDGSHSYQWDTRNRLGTIDSGATANFTYDPMGRRINKNILGIATSFLYDGANAVQELIGGTNTANSLMGGIDEVFQRTDSSGARSFLTDALGSSVALADSTGALQTMYSFDAFGKATLTGSSTTNSFAYTSRELDSTGLYFYRARYYNPALQRFISEDPLGLRSKTTNFYQYTYNSPTNFRDPSGLFTLDIGLTINYTIPLGPIGIPVTVSTGIAIDTHGHVGVVNVHTKFPGLAGGAGGSAGVSVHVSNATTICGLGGPFLNVSGTAGVAGLGGTGDFFTGTDERGRTVDGGGATVGLAGGADASVQVTDTKVSPFGRYSCQ